MTTDSTSERARAERYNPGDIEAKWRARWEQDDLYRVADHVDGRPNRYHLTMFPYTSGDLHVGHWWAMAPSDTLARYFRMRGYNVLFPMGFDAFGLPAENAALKGGIHPKDWTDANVVRMRGQLRSMGASFDWGREVVSSHADYYRWTQWWFVQMFKRGLAYKKAAPANWCPSCNTTLANEQVKDGACERCETPVEQRFMAQWFFRTTDYAEELLDNEALDWPEHVKVMQRNWIGRSEGAEASFALEQPASDGTTEIRVFTTRPDTLHGVTFMVLAPEHPLVPLLTTPEHADAVAAYQDRAAHATEIERLATDREKSGVFTGAYCINRLTGDRVPIWIADYVLATYGTGAVMAVPAHDERDFAFAGRYGMPVKVVIAPPDWDGKPLTEAWTQPGTLVGSKQFDGMPSTEAKQAIAAYLDQQGWGGTKVQYRLRDWLISRQRYWGAPIPIVSCPDCGEVAVPEDQLPVELPYDVEFRPTGQSPLALSPEFVATTCPQCGKPAQRETDTMDTFMCSSWYFMRYIDPHNTTAPMSREAADAWLPVAQYTGGSEHATMHLLYARFFYKVARDLGLVPGDEPFTRYFAQGQILGPDGRRMSKSRGNVVAPDGEVQKWGTDCFRGYLMFLGPWDQGGPYDVDGIVGVSRWLHRTWTVAVDPPARTSGAAGGRALRHLVHATLKKVGEDYEAKRFNTAIAALMELTNELQRLRDAGSADGEAWDEAVRTLALMLAPACPHIAEELWARAGGTESVHRQSWPTFDPSLIESATATLVVQVNGKVRGRIEVPAGADEATAKAAVMADSRLTEALGNIDVQRTIYVPGRLLNFVAR